MYYYICKCEKLKNIIEGRKDDSMNKKNIPIEIKIKL